MGRKRKRSLSRSENREPQPIRQNGCMLCRIELTVDNFMELKPGDQISMPGRIPLLGCLYDHHAVVANIEDISDDGKTAKLTVIDVDDKGKTRWWCPCNRKPFPVKEHGLYNKTRHMLRTDCCALAGPDAVVLKKVVYRKRKFDLKDTVQRARICIENNKNENVQYCFCLQNCEHFACACVNGPTSLIEESLEESISIQSLDFFWVVISLFFWSLQAFFYGLNFWMYAVFVAKDPDFEFLSTNNELRDTLERLCYRNHSSSRHFQTVCDWQMMGVFVGFFTVCFLCIVLSYYVPLYRKKFLCILCFTTIGIHLFFSRLFSFVLVESISIFAEDPVFKLVTSWKMSRFGTILTLMIMSAGGALLVYTIASILTKGIVWMCGKCSGCMQGFHNFVPFKGLMWCLCKLRCCCRDAKRKYFAEEIRLVESEM